MTLVFDGSERVHGDYLRQFMRKRCLEYGHDPDSICEVCGMERWQHVGVGYGLIGSPHSFVEKQRHDPKGG